MIRMTTEIESVEQPIETGLDDTDTKKTNQNENAINNKVDIVVNDSTPEKPIPHDHGSLIDPEIEVVPGVPPPPPGIPQVNAPCMSPMM